MNNNYYIRVNNKNIGGKMKESNVLEPNRRQFITKILPACSVMCLGAGKHFAFTPSDDKSIIQQEKHKFDLLYPRKLTYKQVSAMRYREYILLARDMEKEFGKEKTIEFLKKCTAERLLRYGKIQAKKAASLDLKSYTAQFHSEGLKNTLTMEIIEDTDKVFEIKVTECLSAITFLNAKAGDIGHAAVCWGDYAWAQGFNPKIEMVRDKTLMQGDAYCNHRYVWKG